ncbi:acyltransferase family protein [Hyphomonas sp.]|uniref:acyltransferase family protein n=1 Tax=Hyphomonas sp. TaxID=87 RepID=UPI0039194271
MTDNRFDFIRLFLAASVMVYHAVALGAAVPFSQLELRLAILAEIAIQGFFIVSGLLVASSLERSKTLGDYTGKRIRRLYPAYATIILVPAAISFWLTRDLTGVGAYLAANLVFLNFLAPDLPGLFEGQRFTAVNGALWTLKIEVMFYIALPIILWVLARFGRLWWIGIALLYAGGELWAYFVPRLVPGGLGIELARQLPGQMAYFAMGIALWKALPHIQHRWVRLALAGTGLFGASLIHPDLAFLRAFGLAGLIGALAWAPGWKPNAARFGDISYGLYITHFPILQALVAGGFAASLGFPAFMALGAGLSILASLALWHLVERPALRPSSHYRKVTAQAGR